MKWIVFLIGFSLTSVLPYLPFKDNHECVDKGFLAQLIGIILMAMAALHCDHDMRKDAEEEAPDA